MISNSISMHVKARCIRLLGSGSRTVGALLTLLVMLLVSAAPAVGQLDTGGIAGTILDPTGKVVTGAQVSIREESTERVIRRSVRRPATTYFRRFGPERMT